MTSTFQRKDVVRAASFLRRKLPRIRKAAGPYAELCIKALADIREGTAPDPIELLALILATERVLSPESWSLIVLHHYPSVPCP